MKINEVFQNQCWNLVLNSFILVKQIEISVQPLQRFIMCHHARNLSSVYNLAQTIGNSSSGDTLAIHIVQQIDFLKPAVHVS